MDEHQTGSRAAAELTDLTAWLSRGAREEHNGEIDRAAGFYLKGLTLLDRFTRDWSNQAIPASLLRLASHARKATQARRRLLVESGLDRLERAHGARELRRIRNAFGIYLGDYTADYAPSQKPAFLFVPGIRRQPYYDPAEFSWAGELEAQAGEIISEARAVISGRDLVESFYDQDRSPIKVLMPGWEAFFFYRYGRRFEDNHRLCPTTSRLLDQVSLCHVERHAPETLFSILKPQSHIKPHRGMTNSRLVAHLPLIVPDPACCGLDVGGVSHHWHEGRLVVFDDTFLHSAFNRTDRFRTVLLMDIWHPDLTESERLALSDLIATCMRFGSLSDDVH